MANRRSKTCCSAVDVYDLAAGVRDEFERVIELVGNEPMIFLVAKVVEVLEHLERFTQTIEDERGELEDLRLAVEKMKTRDALNAAEREKHRKEKDLLEDSWRTETKELTEYAAKLQEENLVLRMTIEDLKTETLDTVQSRQELRQLNEEIREVHEKMYSQKDELLSMKQNLSQKESEIEALQSQLDRFTKLNAEYRSRNSASNRQIEQLLEEKADLEVQLHKNSPHSHVQMRKPKTNDNAVNCSEKATHRESCNFEEWERILSTEGKVVVDRNDPDHPCYSQTEMTNVVRERNSLRAQLLEAKEELSLYRPQSGSEADEEPGPVQGPINKEPEEKLHPEKFPKPTRIQRLFQNVFKSSPKIQREPLDGKLK